MLTRDRPRPPGPRASFIIITARARIVVAPVATGVVVALPKKSRHDGPRWLRRCRVDVRRAQRLCAIPHSVAGMLISVLVKDFASVVPFRVHTAICQEVQRIEVLSTVSIMQRVYVSADIVVRQIGAFHQSTPRIMVDSQFREHTKICARHEHEYVTHSGVATNVVLLQPFHERPRY